MGPVIDKLLHDDEANLSPDIGSYTNVDLDQGIADFVGTAPNTFANDFAVSERALTSTEAATAKANGRTYAYVPYAAVPVALMTLVPNTTFTGGSIEPSQYCQHMQLNLGQLDGIFGAPQYAGWGDSRLSCSGPPGTALAYPVNFGLWANADPTMENFALMSLLDSTTASQSAFAAELTAAHNDSQATTASPTPSEQWPFSGSTVPSGDQVTLTKLIDLDSLTELPTTNSQFIKLGAIMPIANDWMGAPLGEQWNLPTAAVQNAEGAYVAPSAAAAEAAEADATLASTTDPTTNNLVTFNASASDSAAYDNYLMLESYLVVPLNGLPADKATALAQFIRFIVGGTGDADIESLGAAPATKAMTTADLVVAQQLNAEAATAAATTSSSSGTTTTTAAAGSTTSTTAASTTGNTGAGASTGASTAGPGSGGLAFTGSDPIPLVALGAILLVFGETARRVVRRRRRRIRV